MAVITFCILRAIYQYLTQTPPTFPLLRLPRVALTEVLRCLDPIELFIFAHCSSKSSAVVPLVKSRSFHIGIDNQFRKRVVINQDYHFSLEKFVSKGKPMSYSVEGLYYCTVHSDDGYEKFIWYFRDLYNSPIRSVKFFPIKDFDQIAKFLLAPQKVGKIEELEICGNRLPSPLMRLTLDVIQKANISLALCIRPNAPRGFVYNFGKLPERLEIKYSHWFNMANLMQASNCAHIDLHKSSLTIQNIQEFISRWKQGEFPNLEYFQAYNVAFNLSDHPDFEDRLNTTVHRKRVKNCDYTRSITNGVKIQRENGQEAEYRIQGNWFKFFVRSEWDIC
ncbi:unnamed protein product [Caenorhabditis brenneri]